ncbi:MAG: CRISPR-associated helicase Cas3' [Coriobacteriales bacterium]|nr:CRISPR-associated helicase Cas3' [Coriobacteriales bacterium]
MTIDSNRASTAELSECARILWGKSGPANTDLWLPLYVHLADTAAIAAILWNEWVPPGTKQAISEGVLTHPTQKQDGSVLDKQGERQKAHQAEEREDSSATPIDLAELVENIVILQALFHDIGKATPVFQMAPTSRFRKNNGCQLAAYVASAGFSLSQRIHLTHAVRHPLASFSILRRNGWDNCFTVIAGAHHGKPPSKNDVFAIMENAWKSHLGFNDPLWVTVQDELVAWAEQHIRPDLFRQIKACRISKQTQVLLTGLVIMADWIASDENLFPLIPTGMQPNSSQERALDAWEHLELAPYQEFSTLCELESLDDLYQLRFSLDMPRPVQRAIPELLTEVSEPGIVVIEAPMGEGKTEAALVAAEVLAGKTGRSGIFFALPTQATSDGIFERILAWVKKLPGMHTITLAHGKAHFNERFSGLKFTAANVNDGEDAVIVSDWAHGRKRAILNDYVVGTIDQVLMGGLKQKHLMLRHLGLANKVVILDECHAYDTYMSQYLYKTLNWLGSYKVPVVVLSATLPISRRQKLVDAYLNTVSKAASDTPSLLALAKTDRHSEWAHTSEYPLITYTSDSHILAAAPKTSGRKLTVGIERLAEQDVISCLENNLDSGGCAGVIVNTVTRAQQLARDLSKTFGEKSVLLLHSRFIAPDRVEREKHLRAQLGPGSVHRPEKLIVVGTQVLEQSLDIDFDILISDICPMDLLIQRIGRLHRHAGRIRPPSLEDAKCYVTGVEGDAQFHTGSERIYGTYLLMNTQALLPEQIVLPDDISRLVQAAYDEGGLQVAKDVQAEYRKARTEYERLIEDAAVKAKQFQIGRPTGGTSGPSATIIDWLDTDLSNDPSGKRAEATVRDTTDSIQVLIIREKPNGRFYTLPWLKDFEDRELPSDFSGNEKLAQTVASSTVNLPRNMCASWIIDKTIAALEKDCCEKLPVAWQQSPWLQGELFLILDDTMYAEVLNFKLHYDREYGLCVERMVIHE